MRFYGAKQVRYGANGAYFYRTLTDGMACTNSVFGDPIFGTVKQCEIGSDAIASDSTSSWTFCATENGFCSFAGTLQVRYGANGAYSYQTLINGTACTNGVFGDPLFGTVKRCDIRAAASLLSPSASTVGPRPRSRAQRVPSTSGPVSTSRARQSLCGVDDVLPTSRRALADQLDHAEDRQHLCRRYRRDPRRHRLGDE